jgi:hypothetical protein
MAKSGTANFYNGVATQSLRVNAGDSLSRAFGATPTSATTMSFGGWVKFSDQHYQNFFSATLGGSGVAQGFMRLDSNLKFNIDSWTGSAYYFNYLTTRVFRDTSAWYHIWVQIDTTDGTVADRVKIYINGVRETAFDSPTHIAGGSSSVVAWNTNTTHYIGNTNATYALGGYIADWWFLDGQDVSPVDTVGEFKNGVFIPKEYSATFGNKGFHLKFDQVGVGTASTSTIGADTSGNTNHWTSSGIVASDCDMPDSPELNWCTLNPLDNGGGGANTLSEGNLKAISSGNTWKHTRSTFTIPDGSWYCEFVATSGIGNGNTFFGIIPQHDALPTSFIGSTATAWAYSSNSYWYNNNSAGGRGASGSGASWATGIVIGLTFDGSTLKFYRENSLEITIGSIPSAEYAIGVALFASDAGVINFGQDPTFAGVMDSSTSAKTPSNSGAGTADSEGNGKFFYAPPSGLALCTANLPEPTIGPNSGTNEQSDDYFNTVLYTSDNIGADGTQNVTGVGFKPDWVWLKNRTSNSTSHTLYDSNRGTGRHNSPDLNTGEVGLNSAFGYLGTFGQADGTADGFVLRGGSTNSNYVAQSTDAYASWNWKSNGGVTSTLTDGSINTTVQVNATAGFSIMTFVSDNQNGTTLAHGLGVAPAWFIIKDRDEDNAFYHYHKGLGSGKFTSWGAGSLGTGAPEASTTVWGNTDPTSTLITVGIGNMSFDNGHNIVAYAFAEVESYSRFGTYTGNGSADGTFVYLGFRPAFFMTKRTDATANWVSVDTAQNPYNVTNAGIQMTTNLAQGTGYANDFLSNGMKIRVSGATVNASGGTYIYMAFAEAPFKYANAR